MGTNSRDRLPSLRSIEAFACTADLMSFSAAADRLHLTASAVSRRVQSLEEEIGAKLFERNTRSIRLTLVGAAYLAQLAPGLDILRGATRKVKDLSEGPRIRIAASSLISSHWLGQRLRAFLDDWPGAAVEISTLQPLTAAAGMSDVDVSLFIAATDSDLTDCEQLFSLDLFPACRPEMAAVLELAAPEDLGRATLIYIRGAEDLWDAWFEAAGAPFVRPAGSYMIDDPVLSLDAVLNGTGVGLVSRLMQPEIDQGRIMVPIDICYRYPRAVYMRTAEGVMDHAFVQAFRKWILELARSEAPASQAGRGGSGG